MGPSGWCDGGFGNSGGCIGRGLQSNGEGGVKVTGKEGAGGAVNEAMNSGAERPTEDSVDGNIVAKGNGKVDGAAVGKSVREDIDYDSTE